MARNVSPQNATLPALPTAAQDKALASLLTGATVTAAARAAGVDRATVHRWLDADPVFIAAYNSFRVEMVDCVRQELRQLAAEAVKAVRSVLTDEATPPAVKLKAAGEVLRLVLDEKLDGPTDTEAAEVTMRNRDRLKFLGTNKRLV